VTSGIDMAVTDFLKKAIVNPLNPLASTSALFQPKVSGSEPLNPAAQALRVATLQAQNLPARQAVQQATTTGMTPSQPLGGSSRLGGSGGLTGGTGVLTPATQPIDPATAQLQQEAANLAQYGTANAPAQAGTPEAPGVQNPPATGETKVPTSPDGTAYTTPPKFADTYRSIYESLGLGDIRSQLDTTGKELQDLQDKKVEEISTINENPWLTEGQRQDRVNAINKKYEMKEGNLTNRIQLFQSTFEQGRQEAQFVASQTAKEQQDQLDRLDKQMEAERKLKAAGQELLSVEDARTLGVPYGTTKAEARQLGITPKEEAKLGAGIVGEYQFYAQQEQAAGRTPVSFNDYQDMDANRKRRILAGAGVGGLLSDTQQTKVESGAEAKAIQAGTKLSTLLDNYKSLVNKYGFDAVGKGKAVLNSAYADLKIAYKEAANLGALTGPDVSIIEEAINPSAGITRLPSYIASGGKTGVIASIDQVHNNVTQNIIQNQQMLQSKWGTYGNDPYIQQLMKPSASVAPEGSIVEKGGAQYRKNADGSMTRIK